MNANALIIILCNTNQGISNDMHAAAARMLAEAEALPGMANDTDTPGLEEAKECGEYVRACVLDYATREYQLSDDDDTLTARIFGTTLGHIDWSEVGSYFWNSARERYEIANGLR